MTDTEKLDKVVEWLERMGHSGDFYAWRRDEHRHERLARITLRNYAAINTPENADALARHIGLAINEWLKTAL
jgi:hypothetical protein